MKGFDWQQRKKLLWRWIIGLNVLALVVFMVLSLMDIDIHQSVFSFLFLFLAGGIIEGGRRDIRRGWVTGGTTAVLRKDHPIAFWIHIFFLTFIPALVSLCIALYLILFL
jgi:hypothetical protein